MNESQWQIDFQFIVLILCLTNYIIKIISEFHSQISCSYANTIINTVMVLWVIEWSQAENITPCYIEETRECSCRVLAVLYCSREKYPVWAPVRKWLKLWNVCPYILVEQRSSRTFYRQQADVRQGMPTFVKSVTGNRHSSSR